MVTYTVSPVTRTQVDEPGKPGQRRSSTSLPVPWLGVKMPGSCQGVVTLLISILMAVIVIIAMLLLGFCL